MIIYKIENKINGKCYIGQTVRTLKERLSKHLTPNSNCSYISNALNKYGVENFLVEIIATAGTIDDLNLLEKKYIIEYNSFAPNGYNLTTGGDNFLRSEETKRKLSLVQKGKKRGKRAKPMSVQHKQKISNALKGQKLSEETKEKISKSLMGTIFTNERKQKISDSKQGEYNPSALLSNLDVKFVKLYIKRNFPLWDIAEAFCVNRKVIQDIKNNRAWKSVGEDVSQVGSSSSNPLIILDEKRVKEILFLIKNRTKQPNVAKKFGVSAPTVSDIKAGRTWSHVVLTEQDCIRFSQKPLDN